MLNASYKMAASTSDKRMPITTSPYNVPSGDVTPDQPTSSWTLPLTYCIYLFPVQCTYNCNADFYTRGLLLSKKGTQANTVEAATLAYHKGR